MSIEAIAILILLALAATGWIFAWCAEDQAAVLRRQRDKARDDAQQADGAARIHAAVGRAHIRSAIRAEHRARDAEQRVSDFIAWVDDLDARALPPVPLPTADQTIPARPWNGTPIALPLPRYEAVRRSRARGVKS